MRTKNKQPQRSNEYSQRVEDEKNSVEAQFSTKLDDKTVGKFVDQSHEHEVANIKDVTNKGSTLKLPVVENASNEEKKDNDGSAVEKPSLEIKVLKDINSDYKTLIQVAAHTDSHALSKDNGSSLSTFPSTSDSGKNSMTGDETTHVLQQFILHETKVEQVDFDNDQVRFERPQCYQLQTYHGAMTVLSLISQETSWNAVVEAIEANLLHMYLFQLPTQSSIFAVTVKLFLTKYAYDVCSPCNIRWTLPLKSKGKDSYLTKAILLRCSISSLWPESVVSDVIASISGPNSNSETTEVGQISAKRVYEVIDDSHSKEIEHEQNSRLISAVGNKGVDSSDNGMISSEEQMRSANPVGQKIINGRMFGLAPTLRPYQEAAVKWMLRRETGSSGVDCSIEDRGWEILWIVFVDSNCCTMNDSNASHKKYLLLPLHQWRDNLLRNNLWFSTQRENNVIFYNPFTGWLVNGYEKAKLNTLRGSGDTKYSSDFIPGGILAESMGLGKTVEVLACILGNQCPKFQHSIQSPLSVAPMKLKESCLLQHQESDFICFCGRGGSNKHSLSWVLCEQCLEPMHGRCAGFNSEEELLSLSLSQGGSALAKICSQNRCPCCVASQHANNISSHKPLIKSRATLIVTPSSILGQWENEINRHMTLPLKVYVYRGVKEICSASVLSPNKTTTQLSQRNLIHAHNLAEADVVLMTFQTLMADLVHCGDNKYADSGRRENNIAGSNLRKRKRYRVVPTPLSSIHWWRLCLDEAQHIETPTASSAKMAMNLVSKYKWCVSGTPIGRGKLNDLFGLFLFLGVRPFNDKHTFTHCLHFRQRGVLDKIRHLLFDILWRSTKKNNSVRIQMGVPEQVETKNLLKFSSIERHFYERQLEDTIVCSNAVIGNQVKKSSPKARDIVALSTSLLRLRAACCHPQVGSHGISKKKMKTKKGSERTLFENGILTMPQILDKLIDDAKGKAEESQRILILHTNALACLTRLKVESGGCHQHDETKLLKKSYCLYMDSLSTLKKNSSPTIVVGEAVLSGSTGFQLPRKIVTDGSALLTWRLSPKNDSANMQLEFDQEIWSTFDFTGASKRICSMQARPLISNTPMSSTSPSNLQGNKFLSPKDCVLQVSNTAMGGLFVDVLSFTLPRRQNESVAVEWLKFSNFVTNRSKSWRIVIRSCYRDESNDIACPLFVGIEVRLMESFVASDNMQKLHAITQAISSISALQHKQEELDDTIEEEENLLQDKEDIFSINGMEKLINQMRADKDRLEFLYMEAKSMVHKASQQKLKEASLSRKKSMSELFALDQNEADSENGTSQWWHDLLSFCRFHADESLGQSLVDFVEKSLYDMYFDPSKQFRRREFPSFSNINGLNIAISLRLNDVAEFYVNLEIPTCIESTLKLSVTPSDAEIKENSQCRKCRADWNQTGPICRFCNLEKELLEYQVSLKHQEISCVFISMFEWIKSIQNRKYNLDSIEEKAKVFFDIKKCCVKELDAAKTKWRFHMDLMSNIDELNQCKQSMRLAYEGEDVYSLTLQESSFIVQPTDINVLCMDHEAKQAMASACLRRDIETLRYLKSQISERQRKEENKTICMICLCPFESSRAVLRCGHVFHYSCLEMLMSKSGGSSSINCPLRCLTKTKKEEVLVASDKRKDDGSKTNRRIEGSWGTKIDRLIADVINVTEVGEKSVVFSQWDDMLEILEQAFLANSIAYVRPKMRKKFSDCINFFRKGNHFVLLMHVKHGAEGLTLVEATHVFMVEPLLNHAMDSQAVNRIHRIGQTSKTRVHRYIVQETIEVKIDKLRMERQEILIEDNNHNRRDQAFKAGMDGGFNEVELQELLK